jgi:hypothetical protein
MKPRDEKLFDFAEADQVTLTSRTAYSTFDDKSSLPVPACGAGTQGRFEEKLDEDGPHSRPRLARSDCRIGTSSGKSCTQHFSACKAKVAAGRVQTAGTCESRLATCRSTGNWLKVVAS